LIIAAALCAAAMISITDNFRYRPGCSSRHECRANVFRDLAAFKNDHAGSITTPPETPAPRSRRRY
jgi:hypothetical protein